MISQNDPKILDLSDLKKWSCEQKWKWRGGTESECVCVCVCVCVPVCVSAAAKSLQSCPTLCDPMDCSPPGFSVHGILQARTLEWVAISFSNHSMLF